MFQKAHIHIAWLYMSAITCSGIHIPTRNLMPALSKSSSFMARRQLGPNTCYIFNTLTKLSFPALYKNWLQNKMRKVEETCCRCWSIALSLFQRDWEKTSQLLGDNALHLDALWVHTCLCQHIICKRKTPSVHVPIWLGKTSGTAFQLSN